jgi:hypothetical protein
MEAREGPWLCCLFKTGVSDVEEGEGRRDEGGRREDDRGGRRKQRTEGGGRRREEGGGRGEKVSIPA